MSDYDTVEVTIGKGDRKKHVTLTPTLPAAKAINRLGGMAQAIGHITSFNIDAYVVIVAAGSDKKPTEVERDVYDAGMVNLSAPLSEFIGIVCNGGTRDRKDEDGGGKKTGEE